MSLCFLLAFSVPTFPPNISTLLIETYCALKLPMSNLFPSIFHNHKKSPLWPFLSFWNKFINVITIFIILKRKFGFADMLEKIVINQTNWDELRRRHKWFICSETGEIKWLVSATNKILANKGANKGANCSGIHKSQNVEQNSSLTTIFLMKKHTHRCRSSNRKPADEVPFMY